MLQQRRRCRIGQLKIEITVAEFSVTLRHFGVISWKYCCHAVIGCSFLNLFDKGMQFVVIVLEGGHVVGAMQLQGFSDPPCSDDCH